MRWEDFRRSDNVEDRRAEGPEGGYSGPGYGLPIGAGGLSIGTIVVLGLIGWALGIDPRLLIGGAEILTGGGPRTEMPYQVPRDAPPRTNAPHGARQARPDDPTAQFVAAVLGDTEDRWGEIFQKAGQHYIPPRLVLFSRITRSACGMAQAAMGPFYCPGDRRIYLDTSFFRDLERRFGGCSGKACQFSQAYVIAHEVGHHVQNLLGILPRVQQMQRTMDRRDANALQVKVELQADCFAGLWAHHSNKAKQMIEPGDIEAALQTASAIGDDRLQRQTQGQVVPDAFTHGTSAQRVRWFSTGLKNGTISSCNTFGTPQL
jgi:predicted metalloprotease